MFERFTEKAIKVIMLAQEEARRLGHNFVGTEQILLGLIGEGTGVAAKVLKSLGVNLKDSRIEVEKMIGSDETGLKLMIKKGYDILELDTFFTSGPEETRAWTIKKNSTAPNAAGKIHSDFEKGFIKAETVSYLDFINNQGWTQSRSSGKMRLEGKDYIVKDGDVLNFRFNT